MRERPDLEAVIGLEVHVQLLTATKMFCADRARYGDPPNTHVCPVCLGLPGALPVVNREAVRLGVRAALGLGCEVHERSLFARKHYFYPDLPKGYQISQFRAPLATAGHLDVPTGEGGEPARVRLRRIHLEEDAGKSVHDRIPGASALDLNRAGVPLLEIVTEPDLRSPGAARSFLVYLKRALEYLGVSDCNMAQGSLRVDANVSLRPAGTNRLGTKTELKNLNSFRGIERALGFEIERQQGALRAGTRIVHETLLWDPAAGEARTLRGKEEGHDYRYLPEPDLPPLVLPGAWISALRDDLPEMPWEREERMGERYGLAAAHLEVLTASRELADFFEAVVQAGAPAPEAASWILGELLAAVKEAPGGLAELRIGPGDLAELILLVGEGAVSRGTGRRVLVRMEETGRTAAEVVAAEGLGTVRAQARVERWIEEALAACPEEVERYRAGEARLFGFFMGRVMGASEGRADPRQVRAALRARLEGEGG